MNRDLPKPSSKTGLARAWLHALSSWLATPLLALCCALTAGAAFAQTGNSYAIYAAAYPAAGGTISCPSLVEHGNTATCTATANPGYAFDRFLTTCGAIETRSNPYTTAPVTSSCSITASFTPLLHFNLRLEGEQVVPASGTSGSGIGTAIVDRANDTITINATFAGLGSVTSIRLHGPAERGSNAPMKIELAARSSPINEVVSYSPADTSQLMGEDWYLQIATDAKPDGELRAQIDNLGPAPKLLTVNRIGFGKITGPGIDCIPLCTYNFPHSVAVTLYATPFLGQTFAGWGGACSGLGACELTMDISHEVSATFTQNYYTVTPVVMPAEGGRMICTGPVMHGSISVCQLVPNAGYRIQYVEGCGGTGANVQLYSTGPMTGNCTVTALFALLSYQVTGASNNSEAGYVTCASPVDHGSTSTCTITVYPQYAIESVSGCGGAPGNSSTFTTAPLTGPCTVTANFVQFVNGVASPTNAGQVQCSLTVAGNSAQCRVYTNAGYALQSVSGCGINPASGTLNGNYVMYTTGIANSPCTVTATYATTFDLISVASRKTHGAAGTFDLALTPGLPPVPGTNTEPRSQDQTHLLVYSFSQPVASPGTVIMTDDMGYAFCGSASATVNPDNAREVLVRLTDFYDYQYCYIYLNGVTGSVSGARNVQLFAQFTAGAAPGSLFPTSDDLVRVRAAVGQAVTASNFWLDINASGAINATDVVMMKVRTYWMP